MLNKGWISFDESEPEDEQRVLVCWQPNDDIWHYNNSRAQVATFYKFRKRLVLDCEMVNGYLKLDLEPVFTHWQILPEPPK